MSSEKSVRLVMLTKSVGERNSKEKRERKEKGNGREENDKRRIQVQVCVASSIAWSQSRSISRRGRETSVAPGTIEEINDALRRKKERGFSLSTYQNSG